MPLPRINASMRISSTYPDRITLNFRFRPAVRPEARSLCTRLQRARFRVARGNEQYRKRIVVSRGGCEATAFLTYLRAPNILNFSISFTPLRVMHDECSLPFRERAVARERNWLHPRQIRAENRHVWQRADALIQQLRREFQEVADAAAPDPFEGRPASFIACSVTRLEIAIDFASATPCETVRSAREAVRRLFRYTQERGYGATAEVFDSWDAHIPVVQGYANQGERYKIYPKTSARVRFECVIDRDAFRRLDIRQSVGQERGGFSRLYRRVAGHVVRNFNALLAGMESPSPPDGGDPFAFMHAVGRVTNDPHSFREIAQALIYEGRIASTERWRQVDRLREAGIVRRASRGLYVLSEQWRSAAAALAVVGSSTLGNLLWGMWA